MQALYEESAGSVRHMSDEISIGRKGTRMENCGKNLAQKGIHVHSEVFKKTIIFN